MSDGKRKLRIQGAEELLEQRLNTIAFAEAEIYGRIGREVSADFARFYAENMLELTEFDREVYGALKDSACASDAKNKLATLKEKYKDE